MFFFNAFKSQLNILFFLFFSLNRYTVNSLLLLMVLNFPLPKYLLSFVFHFRYLFFLFIPFFNYSIMLILTLKELRMLKTFNMIFFLISLSAICFTSIFVIVPHFLFMHFFYFFLLFFHALEPFFSLVFLLD